VVLASEGCMRSRVWEVRVVEEERDLQGVVVRKKGLDGCMRWANGFTVVAGVVHVQASPIHQIPHRQDFLSRYVRGEPLIQ
jgi:hypothetical protein